ncbi:MAG: PaaI family thioesterase [Sphingomonadaceae bacterium]
MSVDEQVFEYREHPGYPGWHMWRLRDETRFNGVVMGELITRVEGSQCRLRMFPERKHTNLQEMIHGAVTLALIDISLFAAMRTLTTGDPGPAVTLELSTQFIGAGKPGEPLDSVVEIVRETGRLLFLRGEVVQEDHLVAAFSGMVRKANRR